MLNKSILLLIIMLALTASVLFAQEEVTPPATTSDYEGTAYDIFDLLYQNDATAIADIDWTVFVLNGDNVAQSYQALTTDEEKLALQTKTIQEIATLIYDEDDMSGYYDWDFYENSDGSYTLYGMTAYFDLYIDFQVSNGKLLVTKLLVEEY